MEKIDIAEDDQILFVTVREYKYLLKCESFFNIINDYFSLNEIKKMIREGKNLKDNNNQTD